MVIVLACSNKIFLSFYWTEVQVKKVKKVMKEKGMRQVLIDYYENLLSKGALMSINEIVRIKDASDRELLDFIKVDSVSRLDVRLSMTA